MVLTDKTRKILWARSGNRCALCRCELIKPETATDDAAVIGDECHIVSAKANGPRSHKKLPVEEYNKPTNLLLLCKVHHKEVDDQENTYTIERLTEIKRQHERWVSDLLPQNATSRNLPITILTRIQTGKDLMDMSSGCLAYLFDHEEPESDFEMELIGAFHQDVQDLNEVWNVIEVSNRVKEQFRLSKSIKELEEHGFWVFGIQETRKVSMSGEAHSWPVFVMTVVRKNNPGITPLGDLTTIIQGV